MSTEYLTPDPCSETDGMGSELKRFKFRRIPIAARGSLKDRLVPEILHVCHEQKVGGILRVESGPRVESLCLSKGRLVSFDSTKRPGESLGVFIFQRGYIDHETYKDLHRKVVGGSSWSDIVIEHSILPPHELYSVLLDYETEKVFACATWSSGEYSFSGVIESVDRIVPLELPMPRIILDVMREEYSAHRLATLLAWGDGAPIYLRRSRAEIQELLMTSTWESRLVRLAEQGRTIEQIIAELDEDRREVLSFFGALLVMELLGFELDELQDATTIAEEREIDNELSRLEQFDDYFSLLGVDPKATPATIRRSFRTLTKLCHPDKLLGLSNRVQKRGDAVYRQLASAQEILSNPNKRLEYERDLSMNRHGRKHRR